MRNYKDFKSIECKVFDLGNITEELFNTREKFCQIRYKQGIFNCNECPIHINYWHLGLSCNEALNQYPDECMKLMEDK